MASRKLLLYTKHILFCCEQNFPAKISWKIKHKNDVHKFSKNSILLSVLFKAPMPIHINISYVF